MHFPPKSFAFLRSMGARAPRLALLPLALLAACASQVPLNTPPASAPGISAPATAPSAPAPVPTRDQVTLRDIISRQDRLYRVAAPLLVKNTELCKGNARSLLGFTAKNKYSYSDELVNAASQLYGMDDRLQVMGVLGNSGAARSGIRVGDKLEAVDGKPVPPGPDAERRAATMLAPFVMKGGLVKLTMSRNGVNMPITVPFTRACAYSIELGNADNVNAYNDGRRVLITRGMMDFASDDNELAYVLAKEMAHNSLNHARVLKNTAAAGTVIDNLIRVHPDMSSMAGTSGIRPMPQTYDAAADTLSLYMVARAGYDIDSEPRFWERLAAKYPPSVPNAYTALHPATSYRLSVMDKIIADIKAKQSRQQALLP
jgi:membrane-associated protease RseP (regulator of RpoE activity)